MSDTTDPFTTAARAEAERYFADPGIDPLALSVIDHAMHMAEWARTHLATQEPTDAEVEATADVLEQMDGMDLEVVARAALYAARRARGATT